jgi:hypothetical protein
MTDLDKEDEVNRKRQTTVESGALGPDRRRGSRRDAAHQGAREGAAHRRHQSGDEGSKEFVIHEQIDDQERMKGLVPLQGRSEWRANKSTAFEKSRMAASPLP